VTPIPKPFIPWVGGKEKLIPYVHAVLPPRFDQYIEAFGGSGAILLSLPRKEGRLEIYNDFNDNLVNLFRCVRDRPMALVQWRPAGIE
jgi:DNA adenine methylase